MKHQLQLQIKETFEELSHIVSSFNEDQINIVPFEGSWTAGQVTEHILMSASGFEQMMNGPVADTDRAPDEFADKLKVTFLDFTVKMQSPDFVLPADKKYEKKELITRIEDLPEKINRSIQTLDLAKTCLAFELPQLGFLTRLESVHFILYHTQRHVHQLKNIHQTIIIKTESK